MGNLCRTHFLGEQSSWWVSLIFFRSGPYDQPSKIMRRHEFNEIGDVLFPGQKEGGQELVGGLDCTVHRNFFGSQVSADAGSKHQFPRKF